MKNNEFLLKIRNVLFKTLYPSDCLLNIKLYRSPNLCVSFQELHYVERWEQTAHLLVDSATLVSQRGQRCCLSLCDRRVAQKRNVSAKQKERLKNLLLKPSVWWWWWQPQDRFQAMSDSQRCCRLYFPGWVKKSFYVTVRLILFYRLYRFLNQLLPACSVCHCRTFQKELVFLTSEWVMPDGIRPPDAPVLHINKQQSHNKQTHTNYIPMNINVARRRNLAVPVICSVSCCAPAAEGGGEADQQLIRDGVVANRRKLRLPAPCWDRQLCSFKKNTHRKDRHVGEVCQYFLYQLLDKRVWLKTVSDCFFSTPSTATVVNKTKGCEMAPWIVYIIWQQSSPVETTANGLQPSALLMDKMLQKKHCTLQFKMLFLTENDCVLLSQPGSAPPGWI